LPPAVCRPPHSSRGVRRGPGRAQALKAWAVGKGKAEASAAELARDPEAVAEVTASVAAAVKGKLVPFEVPAKLALLAEPWTPESDLARMPAAALPAHCSAGRPALPPSPAAWVDRCGCTRAGHGGAEAEAAQHCEGVP